MKYRNEFTPVVEQLFRQGFCEAKIANVICTIESCLHNMFYDDERADVIDMVCTEIKPDGTSRHSPSELEDVG